MRQRRGWPTSCEIDGAVTTRFFSFEVLTPTLHACQVYETTRTCVLCLLAAGAARLRHHWAEIAPFCIPAAPWPSCAIAPLVLFVHGARAVKVSEVYRVRARGLFARRHCEARLSQQRMCIVAEMMRNVRVWCGARLQPLATWA